MDILLVATAVAVGFALPVQTAMNARLRSNVGSTLIATFIAFCVGALTLGAVVLAQSHNLTPAAGTPWWAFCGGFLGAAALAALIRVFPHVGAVESVILPLIGKVIAGPVIDHFGFFNSPSRQLSGWRVLGIVAVLVGVVVAANARSRAGARPALGWRLAGLGIGVLSAIQTAINGNLTVALGSSISSGFYSYCTSVAVLAVAILVTRSWPHRFDPRPWWIWLAGPLGAAYVVGLAAAAPALGTGVAILIALAGQICGSSLIDHFGLFSASRTPVTAKRTAGVALLIAGMAAYSLL